MDGSRGTFLKWQTHLFQHVQGHLNSLQEVTLVLFMPSQRIGADDLMMPMMVSGTKMTETNSFVHYL